LGRRWLFRVRFRGGHSPYPMRTGIDTVTVGVHMVEESALVRVAHRKGSGSYREGGPVTPTAGLLWLARRRRSKRAAMLPWSLRAGGGCGVKRGVDERPNEYRCPRRKSSSRLQEAQALSDQRAPRLAPRAATPRPSLRHRDRGKAERGRATAASVWTLCRISI